MIVFKKLPDPDNNYDQSTVIVKTTAVSLPEILKDFEDFLRACGFSIEGELDIVTEELEEQEYE